ncbi:MAG: heavy-metal-associated domain-containing protein [Planctomycetota bacterium]
MRTFTLLFACSLASLTALGCSGDAAKTSTSDAQVTAPMANAVALHFVLDTPPSCEGCVAHIQSVVEKLDGFAELVATPQDPEIVVKVDPAKLDAAKVLAALTANDRPGHVKP